MNVANIRALAARLRAPVTAGHFNMASWLRTADYNRPLGQTAHECGTVACIAGHAAIMALPNRTRDNIDYIPNVARDYLGLTEQQAKELFTPPRVYFGAVTAPIAADVLDHLADTGEIVWPRKVCG